MGDRLRALDWKSLGLEPPASWPPTLRAAISICLSSSFPTCIYWGPELRLLYNDAWSVIPAERHPAALGQPAHQVWADIWHIVEPQLRQVIDTGRGFSAYDQLLPMVRRGRVQETWWTYSFTPLFDERERVVGVLNQGHETTAAVLAERAHRDEVALLRELFDLAPAAVALLRGPTHVFEMANEAYLALVGGRELIGRPLSEALPEIVGQGFVELLDRVYASGETYRGAAVPVALQRPGRPTREERLLDFIYQPLRDAAGKPMGVLVMATDVTDRESALAGLREADRRKDIFIATLAHELRNPLAPIRNGLEVLKLIGGHDARIAAAREMMERQTRHLVHLVDDLLDISRISTGKIQLRRERVPLQQVLVRAVESTSTAYEQKAQRLRIAVPDEDLLVDGDAERLAQVFANLLGNASKFTAPEGNVILSAKHVGNQVEVSVEDDGIGIARESLDKVFDLFEQLGAPGTMTGGLGIGLALVSQLVQMHGGSVGAWSEGAGRGSRFTVTLPLVTASASSPVVTPDAHPRAAPAARRRRRVLVVDDHADAADSLAELLRLDGHEVHVVRDGPAALDAIPRAAPEVVFMDLGMPGMDGLEATRRIRRLPGGKALRIVALTGWGQESDRERTREAGIDLHLVKPVDAVALRHALDD